MNNALPLAVVSAVMFLLLWFAYETKPQEVTLWLMGLALVGLAAATVSIGLDSRRPRTPR